jgi:hypothetical protein
MTAPSVAKIPNGYPYYLFGGLGRLVPIQVPVEGFSNTITEYGTLHSPLSGEQTKDVFGYKAAFQIPLDALDARAWSYVEMVFRGAVSGPYYLIDPRRRNRLTACLSSSTTVYSPTPVLFPSSGTLGQILAATYLLPDTNGKFSQGPNAAAVWTTTAAASMLGEAAPIPVIPGETITFSCYVQAGSPTLELVPYNRAMVAQPPWTGTVDVPGSIDRKYITRRIPLDGSVIAVQPQLRAAGAGTYTTLAWQLTDHSGPESWVLGPGVFKVLMDGLGGQGAGSADWPTRTQSGSLNLYEV